MLLKDRPVKSSDGGGSDTIYIRGLPRTETDGSVLKLLSKVAPPVEIDLHSRSKSGEVWVKYNDIDTACQTIQTLHHSCLNGSILSVKYELGLDDNGKRIVDRSSHSTIIRRISPRKDGEVQQPASKKQKLAPTCTVCNDGSSNTTCNCAKLHATLYKSSAKSTPPGVSYTSNSICVGEMEYPFPSGMYLTRVIELTNKMFVTPLSAGNTATSTDAAKSNPLLAILTDTRSMGNKYAKEISETMAMVDAIQRAISLLPPEHKAVATGSNPPATHLSTVPTPGISTVNTTTTSTTTPTAAPTNRVNVYVLGDGKRPLCAAAACLHLPGHFSFYSVDPLMMPAYSCSTDKATTDTDSDASNSTIVPNSHYGAYQHRFFPLSLMSQDFAIPETRTSTDTSSVSASGDAEVSASKCLSIVVSCHSHAPLQEFWERLRGPKVAVTMACCAEYAALYNTPTPNSTISDTSSIPMTSVDDARALQYKESMAGMTLKSSKGDKKDTRTAINPILEFDDFEVYSPKRRVKIYFDL